MMLKLTLIFTLLFSANIFAQAPGAFNFDDDLNIGEDIFSDFNEDLEATDILEDERFYRYSRFFGVNLGVGVTTFTGNRGAAFQDNHPSYALTVMYFIDFHTVFVLGFEHSQHTAFIDTFVTGSPNELIGAVESSYLRPFFGVRSYIDTTNLGTAITYSNPYFVGRLEFWYQTNRFPENDNISDESGGGLGAGFGFGLEFPIELKETYFNIEFLYHTVNFFDKFTQDFKQIDDPNHDQANFPSEFGFDDLTGDVITVMMSYNVSW